MRPFIGIVHKESGSIFGIAFPDAPGCFSAADTLDEVFPMAEEALYAWMETTLDHGGALPERRDISAISADPEWSEAFATAALIIALPAPSRSLDRAA